MHPMILPLLLLLAGCSGAPAVTDGGGIVSLNPCGDQLLLELVPPARIAALSHYSMLPGAASVPLNVARRFASTAGTAEEVIALAPDRVVASSFTPAATREAFARAGLKTIYLDAPNSVSASQDQVRELAQFLDVPAAGDALNQRIAAALTAKPPAAVPTLLYISGDLVNGSGTLLDELMTRSGFANAAADYGLKFTGTLPVETILSDPPRVILNPDAGGRTATLRTQLLARIGHAPHIAQIDPALTHCGGPTIPRALNRLRAIRAEVRP